MQRSKIEWLRNPDGSEGYTWNPIKMRCTPISEGCDHCWHLRWAKRHSKNPKMASFSKCYEGREIHIMGEADAPLKKRKSTRIAVQLMGDLFHVNMDASFIEYVFTIMRDSRQHTFYVLTKRPERMVFYAREFFKGNYPANIWFGASAENQLRYTERLPDLLKLDGANLWVSLEPLLGPINLGLQGIMPKELGQGYYKPLYEVLTWVVVGAETGFKKRPCPTDWIYDIRNQCKVMGTPFFGKVYENGTPIGPREWHK